MLNESFAEFESGVFDHSAVSPGTVNISQWLRLAQARGHPDTSGTAAAVVPGLECYLFVMAVLPGGPR